MGRKPNALILEFFERGAKLDDQSNRYEHVCKMCGLLVSYICRVAPDEHILMPIQFAKGRAEVMHRHLFEECPNINDFDKARAFVYAQGQVALQRFANQEHLQAAASRDGNTGGLSVVQSIERDPPAQHATLNREPSALDTLAEVSRQHLDLSRQRLHGDNAGPLNHDPSLESHEMENWMIQLRDQLAEANQAHDDRLQTTTQQPQADSNPLVEAASAANQLNLSLERFVDDTQVPPIAGGAISRNVQSNLDPALHTQDSDDTQSSIIEQQMPPPPAPAMSMRSFSTQYGTADGHHYGLLARPLKIKSHRTKFSAERRKEVGSMRKLGACLRCRMLKKPCSGETPCATCSAIGIPRLWQATCIRTRVADEFSLYNTSYFFAKARDKVNALIGSTAVEKSGGQIEVSFFNNEEGTRLTLPAFQTCGGSAPQRLYALQVDTQDAIKAVETYLFAEQSCFVEAETNSLVRTTLDNLRDLTSARSDPLASQTIMLYSASLILNGAKSSSWRLAHVMPGAGSNAPKRVDIDSARSDFPLLRAQMLDAVERSASMMIKQVCHELERRLLARATSTPMVTFLVTVLLLNCVERMSLLFRSFDTRSDTKGPNSGQETMIASAGAPTDWPLTRPPSAYFKQGAAFSELLILLLRMRSLPPRTMLKNYQGNEVDDILDVVKTMGRHVLVIPPEDESQDFPPDEPPSLNGTMLPQSRVKAAKNDQLLLQMSTWLARTKAGVGELLRQAGRTDDEISVMGEDGAQIQSPSAWDMRFIAELILPADLAELVQAGRNAGDSTLMDVDGNGTDELEEDIKTQGQEVLNAD